MICCLISNAEKAANKKELHQDRKLIIHFLKVASSMAKRLAHQLQFSSKIIIHAAAITKSNAAFHVPGHADFVAHEKFGGMKIIVVAGISAQDLQRGLLLQVLLQKK
jgi:hypothetical protein